jgi:hypothetical protein
VTCYFLRVPLHPVYYGLHPFTVHIPEWSSQKWRESDAKNCTDVSTILGFSKMEIRLRENCAVTITITIAITITITITIAITITITITW